MPLEMQRAALKTIYSVNVEKLGNGEVGAANGMKRDGTMIRDNEQAQEVWVGTSFAVAALLKHAGMREEAYKTAEGLYRVIYEKKGYWFRTPESWDAEGNYRASMYMRPAAAWALEMTPAKAE